MQVPFATASMRHDGEVQSTTERLINMFPEAKPDAVPVLVRSAPGWTETSTFTGAARAMVRAGSDIYIAAGGGLWRYDGLTTALVGGVPDDAETTMAYNGTHVGVVSGGQYNISDGSTVSTISGGAFSAFGSIESADGYFVLTEKDGSRYACTSLNDASDIPGLFFGTADYQPDNLVAVKRNLKDVWLFGKDSIQVAQNVGGSGFPFQAVPGMVFDIGCKSAATVVQMENSIIWVADDNTVRRSNAGVISTPAVSAALDRTTGNLAAFEYHFDGHIFYVLRFQDRPAWVFDVSTGAWHERSSGTRYGAFCVTASAQLGSDWYAGTCDGVLGAFGGFTEGGSPLRREATSQAVSAGGTRFSPRMLDVEVTRGTGATLMAQFSRDAETFSRERYRDIPAQNYNRRVTFRGLGQGREFAARMACTDNADFGIHGAKLG